ncbi:hypothetical protein [Singulisphaera acidiphila]|uniref:Secreted protein n=1 Tax=Singulisphaera acidiphila (strain ATCC BAA-1392 / DSM 18658 / VKM B-2454 / MOB10) TaxID=886293 RepID=L0DKH4_SINAD|nr:hypothetical protein [Singulisphaera acidiphila]AGA29343.1 hypothetical protein Sinac_5191 [Singulisphaera acidiphila DSM 18658]
MRVRFFLASLLSLPCLALVGCGNSSSTDAAANAPLSAEDIATAKADAARVADEERAYQKSEAPAGKSR